MTAILQILIGTLLLGSLVIMFLASVSQCWKCGGWCLGPIDCEMRRRKKGLQ